MVLAVLFAAAGILVGCSLHTPILPAPIVNVTDSSGPIVLAWMKERDDAKEIAEELKAKILDLEYQLSQSKELIEAYDDKLLRVGRDEEECRDMLRDQMTCECLAPTDP